MLKISEDKRKSDDYTTVYHKKLTDIFFVREYISTYSTTYSKTFKFVIAIQYQPFVEKNG